MSKRPPAPPRPPAQDAPAPSFNPVSRWEEPVEVPGLTLFDIHRAPRRENARDSGERVRMPLKVLAPEFHCPVCLGYMKNTRIVKECLHRFCNECIEKCLRLGKKECPQCRIHIPSRRNLRPDRNFDALIAAIHGDVERLERYEEEEIVQLNRKNMNNAYAESRKRGILHQTKQRVRRTAAPSAGTAPAALPASRPAPLRVGGLAASPLVEFVLRRHPQETRVDRLQREHLRAARELRVRDVRAFLGRKLGYAPCRHFQILATAEDNVVVLPDDISLALVRRDICDDPATDVVLHYRIFPRDGGGRDPGAAAERRGPR